MKGFTLDRESQLDKFKRNKSENACFKFQIPSNKAKIEEAHFKNLEERKAGRETTIRRKERPKSASLLVDVFSKVTDLKKRPKSTEFLRWPVFSEKVGLGLTRKKREKLFEGEEFCCCRCCCCREPRRGYANLDSRSLSGCCLNGLEEGRKEPWAHFNSRPLRKYRSNPNFSKTPSRKLLESETEFHKVTRSLRLLGFELSDFGICSDWVEARPKKKPVEKSASLSTKITCRSVSLDSLRVVVKRAWMDDCVDESHRRLLAQAAYEEWYFKKEREMQMKRNEERLTRLKAKENLRDHFERKREKSEVEFRKWLHRKRLKRKSDEKNFTQKQENSFVKLMKTKEESEKAFIKWKKSKEEEIGKMKKEKKKEEERRLESERKKKDKKIMAEKAFQQWRIKLKETEKLREANRKRPKSQQEVQERRKRKEGTQISFEAWKAAKDEQIKEKIKQIRKAFRMAREERLVQMEERMYEADQAFEDWLEKAGKRKLSDMNVYNKLIPWIPA